MTRVRIPGGSANTTHATVGHSVAQITRPAAPSSSSSGAPSPARSDRGCCRQCVGPLPSTPARRSPRFCSAPCGKAYLAAKRRAARLAAPAGPDAAPKAGGSAPRSGRLGNTASNVSPAGQDPAGSGQEPGPDAAAVAYAARRAVRFRLRRVNTHVSALDRVRKCGTPCSEVVGIKVGSGAAHYLGLSSCGSIWACPVCSATIRHARSEDLEAKAAVWMRAGHSLAMATFTVRHHSHDRLKQQIDAMTKAFRKMQGGKGWQQLRTDFDLVGMTKAIEITHGENGWHTHFHVLLWLREDLPDDQSTDRARLVEDQLYARWHRAAVKAGLGEPTRANGVRVDPVRRGEAGARDLAKYIAKVQDKDTGKTHSAAMELTRVDLKSARRKSRTPFQILDDFSATGDAADLALWNEYEKATKGHKALTWTPALVKELKKLLAEYGQDEDERTDEEILAAEQGGDLAGFVSNRAFGRYIARHLTRDYELLQAAETGGWHAIVALCRSWGVPDEDLMTAPVLGRSAS